MTPGYSFVIPAYNDAEGLQRHFQYFAQCHDRVQLVIVDDCSLDETQDVVAAANLPGNVRVTYHRMEQNSGPGVARNTGLDLAEEDWLLFLDADDVLAPLFFDVVNCLPDDPIFDFAMFKHHLSFSRGARFTYNMHAVDRAFFSSRLKTEFPYDLCKLHDCPGVLATVNFPWNKLYRREFLLRAQIRFPDLRMHEDVSPHWSSFLRCDRFAVLGWAPPLLTHFEIPSSDRATQYVGEKRLAIFSELERVEKEIGKHTRAKALEGVFSGFCDDIFTWLTGGLCDQGGQDGEIWRPRYQEAIVDYRAKSQILKQETSK